VRVRFLALWERGALPLLAALLSTSTFFAAPALSEGFALIRSGKNANIALSRSQVRDMALGRKKAWPQGPVAVLVLTRPGTPELRWFATTIVGLTDTTMLARIKEQVFRGEMRKPITATTEQEMLTAVAAEEGAIGVVRTEATKNLPEGVALLPVQ
jgi:hypothetical protein